MSERLPRYRLLTGPDDAVFGHRVSRALELGYELYGNPALAWNGTTGYVAQAVVWRERAASSERAETPVPYLRRTLGTAGADDLG